MLPELVRECDYHSDSGYRKVGELIEEGVTAIFSTSDLITTGVMNRLAELGVRVPQDVSVVSFDRNEVSVLYLPGITAVQQDVGELVRRAFDLLMMRVRGEAGEPELSNRAPSSWWARACATWVPRRARDGRCPAGWPLR